MSYIRLLFKLKNQYTVIKVRPKKWISSIIINMPLIIIIDLYFHCISQPLSLKMYFIVLLLGGGLFLGETIFFGHLWRPIESKLKEGELEWRICITSHITYAFLACKEV